MNKFYEFPVKYPVCKVIFSEYPGPKGSKNNSLPLGLG